MQGILKTRTLRSYSSGRATAEIPVWQMIAAPLDALAARVQVWQAALAWTGAQLWAGESAVGGGSLPGETLPTTLLAIPHAQAEQVAARLRRQSTPVITRIQQAHVLLDPRTVLPAQDPALLGLLAAALGAPTGSGE